MTQHRYVSCTSHDVTLPFQHILKVFYWIKIWWLWGPSDYSECIVMLKKPIWDHLSFVAWCAILLEEAIRRQVHCGLKRMNMVTKNTQVGCGNSLGTEGFQVCQENITTITSLNCWYKAKWIHASVLFAPNSDPTNQMWDKAKNFQSSIFSFCWANAIAVSCS